MTATQTDLTWVTGDAPTLISPNMKSEYSSRTWNHPSRKCSVAITLWFDGGCRSNPKGVAGSGAVCRRSITGEHLFETYQSLTGKTNNYAEWFALYLGLQELVKYCEREAIPLESVKVRIRGDSKLVIEQLIGNWKIRNEKFRECYESSHAVLQKVGGWNADHVYRSMNGEADALANKAMDNGH